MLGMQLAAPLLPFALYVTRANATRLAPFFGLAALALLMGLDELRGPSTLLRQIAPVLGLSRFPAGDYRTLLAVPLLVALCAGVREAQQGRPRARWYGVGLGLMALLVLPPLQQVPFPELGPAVVWIVALSQFLPAGLLGLVLVRAGRRTALRQWLPLATTLLSLASMPQVLATMQNWWHLPNAAAVFVERSGVQSRLSQVFATQYPARPAREHATNEFAISWRGYLAGQFMADDYGGTISVARQRIQADPSLRTFMDQPSTLVTQPAQSDFRWQPVDYGRSSIRYHVVLAQPGVVVENEIFSRGWHATSRAGGAEVPLEAVEIDGALRGWRVPAGDQELRLGFETPLLGLGLTVSAAAAAVYVLGLIAAVGWRARMGAPWSAPRWWSSSKSRS
jgi:hypothetical protein